MAALAALGADVERAQPSRAERSALVHSASCRRTLLDVDHLDPWTGRCRTTALLSGRSTSVLSNAGHTASLIIATPEAGHPVGGQAGPGAAAWREASEGRTGCWWEAWSGWVLERPGETTDALSGLGSERHPPLEPAPGAYVLDREPVSERLSSTPSGRHP